jgi:hypothetical protein
LIAYGAGSLPTQYGITVNKFGIANRLRRRHVSLDWETALRAIPLVAGALFSLYRFRSLEPRLRSKLKSDLEILSGLDPESSAHALLKRNIEEALRSSMRSLPLNTTGGKWLPV